MPRRPLNIALITQNADPARGGAERYTADLASALAAGGNRVSLLASKFGSPVAGVEFVHLDDGAATRLGGYLKFLDTLEGHFASQAYDVRHAMLPVRDCDVYHPHAGFAVESVASGHLKHATPAGRVLAGLANRVNRKRQRFAAVERQLLTRPNPPFVLCLSAAMQDAIRKHVPVDPSRLVRLFNGVDLHRFDPSLTPDARSRVRQTYKIAGNALVALFVGQDFRRKGLAECIAAMAKLRDDRLVLLVVGRDEKGPYERLAAGLGIGDRVIFAGPAADTVPFYSAADFVLFPSKSDPFGLVPIEAAAMGVPVILSKQSGASEVFEGSAAGIILPDAADVDALVDAMRRLLDPEVRREMSTAADALRPTLSFEHHLQRLSEVYWRVVAE